MKRVVYSLPDLIYYSVKELYEKFWKELSTDGKKPALNWWWWSICLPFVIPLEEMNILTVLCSHFTKKQHNITEFPSLSGWSKRVCEHVGNAGFKKAIDSFDKSFIFAVCADYYLLLAFYISSFFWRKKCIQISHRRTVRHDTVVRVNTTLSFGHQKC